MTAKPTSQVDALTRANMVRSAATTDFNALVDLAGLDPAWHFRFANWAGLDARRANLRGFDFTGAVLTGARFNDALIGPGVDASNRDALAARFDGAVLAQVDSSTEQQFAGSFDPPELANLQTAQDYRDFVASWRQAKSNEIIECFEEGDVFWDASAWSTQHRAFRR
jgi:Pentapeptide repeats (8 copies)